MKLTAAESSVELLCLAFTPHCVQCNKSFTLQNSKDTKKLLFVPPITIYLIYTQIIQALKGDSGIFVIVPVDHLRGEPQHGPNGCNVSFGVTMTVFTTVHSNYFFATHKLQMLCYIALICTPRLFKIGPRFKNTGIPLKPCARLGSNRLIGDLINV